MYRHRFIEAASENSEGNRFEKISECLKLLVVGANQSQC